MTTNTMATAATDEASASASFSRGVTRHTTESSYNATLLMQQEYDDPTEGWDSLEQRLQSACQDLGGATARTVSLQDLEQQQPKHPDFHNSANQTTESITEERPVSTEDLLEAWKQLLTALKQEKGIYTEYANSLERALIVTLLLAKSSNSNNNRLRTLLDLLTQSVREHARDPSLECRFVTLLEVLLSYGPNWEPSPEVAAFWVRLLQRIPNSIAPINFRRKAYRVLVSLSWVPSSKGLLEACSFEASKQLLQFLSPPIQQHMARIGRCREGPLPRYDSVNQLLDRLKDETDVCVAIQSEKQGTGKTTLAGQVASHPSIRRVFTVLWLDVTNNIIDLEHHNSNNSSFTNPPVLSYDRYQQYLDELCHQLRLANEHDNENSNSSSENKEVSSFPVQKWPTYLKRFEEPALRRLRERDCMKQAKELMSNEIRQHEKNLLLILNNVHDVGCFLEWFRFDDRQSVIVTTPLPTGDPVHHHDTSNGDFASIDWTLELAPMSVEEAVELFLLEAGLPATHLLGCTTELRSIVQQCDCHPLTVRTMARWFQLKQVTAGIAGAMQEIVYELELLRSMPMAATSQVCESIMDDVYNDPNMMLFDILSLMMGPGRIKASRNKDSEEAPPSSLFVLCFAAYVVVFPTGAPLDCVILLWEQILKMEPLAVEEVGDDCPVEEITRHAWRIAEGLIHMGVLSIVEKDDTPCVNVHHVLYRDFAFLMAREMELKETVEDTIADWHIAFVTGYFERKSHGKDEKHDGSFKYTMEKLGSHMFEGKMASTAEIVLADDSFFGARIAALGWQRGIEVQIEDCVALQHEIEEEAEGTGSEVRVSSVFRRTATLMHDYLSAQPDIPDDVKVNKYARALFSLAFALAENGYIDAALEHLKNAEKLFKNNVIIQELQASILYAVGWCLLEANETDRALQKISASREMMEEGPHQHGFYNEMLRLHAHALIGACEYSEAAACFTEALDKMKENVIGNRIEIGATHYFQGRLFYMMGEIEKARASLVDCLKWKTENCEVSHSLATAQGILGDVNVELRLISEAKEHYEAALKTLRELNCDAQHLDYRLLHGKLQLLRNDTKGCKKSFELVRRTIKESPLTGLDQSACDLRNIARAYDKFEDFTLCETIIRESLVLTESRPFSLERSWGLVALGDCLVNKNDDVEALACYEQALEIQIEKLGNCREIIDTASLIGSVHLSLGNNAEALRLLDENLERVRKTLPNDTERIAGIVYMIGDAYHAMGDFARAAGHFQQCMDTLKLDRGEDHLDIAKALHRLGDVSAAQKDSDKAFDCYSQALNIRRMHFDEHVIADTLHCIGVLSRRSNDPELAREALLEALEIRKRHKNDHGTAETMLEVGICHRLGSEAEKAMELFSNVLKLLNDQDPLRGTVDLEIGNIKLSQGDSAGAMFHFGAALMNRASAFGQDDVRTGKAALRMGLVKFLEGHSDVALADLDLFGQTCRLAGEVSSISADFALYLLLEGDIYVLKGETEHAHHLWIRANEICDHDKATPAKSSLRILLNRRLEDLGTASGDVDIDEKEALRTFFLLEDE